MNLLVITTLPDPHLDMVKSHLPLDTNITAFDPYSFPNDEMFSVLLNHDYISTNVRGGNVSHTSTVWYRKPLLLKEDSLPVPDEYKKIAYQSYKEGITWLYSSFPRAFWVSDYWSIKKTGSKISQLLMADELGFNVPETLVTSSPTDAEIFVNSHENIVVKPLNIEFIKTSGKVSATYTTRISRDQRINFTGLSVSPTIFQQEIKGTDVRVTVVGNDVFACAIEKQGKTKSFSDWRIGINDNTISIIPIKDFPTILAQSCVTMVRKLGLKFGAFDFIQEESTGKYWFLEINPNGQWAFVELQTGLNISLSLATLLMSKNY